MAVPSNPTVTSIITEALRYAGQSVPSASQISSMATGGFQTVKTEIWSACTNDELLKTITPIILARGSGQVDTPSDFSSPVSLDVYTGSEAMAFTASAGGASSITAPSTFSASEDSLLGLYLFTTGGTGSGQYRQITAYDDDTKVLTVAPAWTTNPASDTTAFIGQLHRRLEIDDPKRSLYAGVFPSRGFPVRYRMAGVSPLNSDMPAIEIWPVPDTANYAMLLTYIPNLTRLDETGSIFVKHLRERRSLWMAGIIMQACLRYDEARLAVSDGIWQRALLRHASHNHLYGQVTGAR